MASTYAVAVVFVVVLVAYGYLKIRDARLRGRGATDVQLHARSRMTALNYRGGYIGVVGVVFLLAGVYLPIEKRLNAEPVQWVKSAASFVMGLALLSLSAWTLSRASKLKQFSQQRD